MDGETRESLETIKAGILALAEPEPGTAAHRYRSLRSHVFVILSEVIPAGQVGAYADQVTALVMPELEDLFNRLIRACDDREQAAAALTAVYRERAHFVALLAALYPSHIGFTDPNEPDWAVVIIETPAGQLSWHIAPGDMDLFGHVQPTTATRRSWDGHTTDEKYERIRELTAITAAAQSGQPEPVVLETYTQVRWSVDFADSAGEWWSPAWDLATAGTARAALAKYKPEHPGQPWRIVKVTATGRVELVEDSTAPGQ